VSGKYKAASKKVVSDFSKEQLVRMHFLNRRGKHRLRSRRAKCRFSVRLRDVSYEFFTERSGLPDVQFSTLFHGTGTQVVEFAALGNAAYFAGSVFQAMTLIVLTTICLLACVFLLFVLIQWMRDSKRKTTTRPVVDKKAAEIRETKHPYIVGARKAMERRDRFKGGSRRLPTVTKRRGGRESGYDERERIAYERIVRSFKPGKTG
jgi:hypothetical protein